MCGAQGWRRRSGGWTACDRARLQHPQALACSMGACLNKYTRALVRACMHCCSAPGCSVARGWYTGAGLMDSFTPGINHVTTPSKLTSSWGQRAWRQRQPPHHRYGCRFSDKCVREGSRQGRGRGGKGFGPSVHKSGGSKRTRHEANGWEKQQQRQERPMTRRRRQHTQRHPNTRNRHSTRQSKAATLPIKPSMCGGWGRGGRERRKRAH